MNIIHTFSSVINKMFICILLIHIQFGLIACRSGKSEVKDNQDSSLVDLVNPLMGTASTYEFSHGNVYPAIARPWGMNFWTPQTGDMHNNWIYQYDAKKIQGFRHTHQPSPWMGDYGAFSVMPMTGKLKINGNERASGFSHLSEVSKPYFYKVELEDYHISAQLTSSERSAIIRFTFPASTESKIVLDAFDMGSEVHYYPSENKISGFVMNNNGGVPEGFKQYFVARLNKSPGGFGVWKESEIFQNITGINGKHVGAYLEYNTEENEIIEIRIGSSFISLEQAEKNLDDEIGQKSFEEVKLEGMHSWNSYLNRIRVEGGSEEDKRIFYSCFYRALLFPRIFYEFDKEGKMIHYSPYDGKVHAGPMFADNGFWDTFRAVFPFYTLLFPDKDALMMQWLVNAYEEGGWLPIWPSPGYRNVMIGAHSASLFADAMVKGITGFDSLKAFEAVLKDAFIKAPDYAPGRDGMEYYNKLGYCPYPEIGEATAKTLEYAYDDFCIRQMASILNKKEEENIFYKKSFNYKKVFDKSVMLMQGRKSDGSFLHSFSPLAWGGPFTEGNAWHYTWSVFHDPRGLIDLMGGEKEFTLMMDSVFNMPPVFDKGTYPVVIHEISEMVKGNMGQYAHGNQPVQHMIYLYNYAGQPWKSQYWLRQVMMRLYNSGPEGYCGDEDTGQMSAWYIFSAMGFYPVCPGVPEYVIGSPVFNKIRLCFESGREFTILAENNSEENCYIQTASLNDREFTRNWIFHSELTQGGVLNLNMGSSPEKQRGVNPGERPYSLSSESK
jgi:predicted alpha-1,2-mannosidase